MLRHRAELGQPEAVKKDVESRHPLNFTVLIAIGNTSCLNLLNLRTIVSDFNFCGRYLVGGISQHSIFTSAFHRSSVGG